MAVLRGDGCEECLSPMPMTHWHYEEDYAGEYAPTPHPHPMVDEWEKFIREATGNKPDTTPVADPTTTERVSKRHMDMQVDGNDFVCNACGSVSGDFDLFEEVGAEVGCKVVEEAPKPKMPPRPIYYPSTPPKTKMGVEVMKMYKKMLDDLNVEEERKAREFELPHPEKKSYTELAKEFRTAKEDPENQKKWYSDVMREMQRRERRR